jgi:hypothetical protein
MRSLTYLLRALRVAAGDRLRGTATTRYGRLLLALAAAALTGLSGSPSFDGFDDGGAHASTPLAEAGGAADGLEQADVVTGPITFVQVADTTPPPATTASAPFSMAQSGGNLIVVAVGWNSAGGVAKVTDTSGNTYKLAVGPNTASILSQSVYYAAGIRAASNKYCDGPFYPAGHWDRRARPRIFGTRPHGTARRGGLRGQPATG